MVYSQAHHAPFRAKTCQHQGSLWPAPTKTSSGGLFRSLPSTEGLAPSGHPRSGIRYLGSALWCSPHRTHHSPWGQRCHSSPPSSTCSWPWWSPSWLLHPVSGCFPLFPSATFHSMLQWPCGPKAVDALICRDDSQVSGQTPHWLDKLPPHFPDQHKLQTLRNNSACPTPAHCWAIPPTYSIGFPFRPLRFTTSSCHTTNSTTPRTSAASTPPCFPWLV